jgi:signal transduction histidine kinase/ActR/RegA family two-component response regulator
VKTWFKSQPIHRKLVVTSMLKTTVVLALAMMALLVLDAWRFNGTARQDGQSLGSMVAEVVRPALAFGQWDTIQPGVEILRLRAQVERGCVYGKDGTLHGQYLRNGAEVCPPAVPEPGPWYVLDAVVPVVSGNDVVGYIYISRDWQILMRRLQTAGLSSLTVLILASGVMFLLSHRLHRTISEPISRLASATAEMGRTGIYVLPPIEVAQDEVGQLVTSVSAMVDRVQQATHDLTRTNEALRFEIEERQLVEKEREALLRREQEANRIKDEFLATVSHELRTPLNAIVGWAQILSTTTPEPAIIAKAAASLHRNAQTQARVIDDLIDISRIVTGKLRVDPQPVDLRNVVEASVEAIRPMADHGRVALTVTLPADACVIMGDRARLQQVVWNLLSNAVKFAPAGRVLIEVRQEDAHLDLIVSDDGQGIAPEFLPHVFDRFRQADSSVTRQHGGLGIGLAVVKELVELQGGTLKAESAGRGSGATFSIRFPCATGDVPCEDDEDRMPSLQGISILAVDDNADSLDVLEAVLLEAGARVRTATSGAAALERWQREPADVLLCDIAMPYMSGYELLTRIRDLDRLSGRMTPAIAVTAHATDELVARSAQAGFQLHIAKPFDRKQLLKAIVTARIRI